MEPQELAKNDEGSGYSKRRNSSILKAPRKSARFPDPEQQENTVECAKPAEKRNSRRVSFAPANDVLLFSKDVKNASSSRSPLQELRAATGATTQNRAAEDGIQQIMGMDTLLSAPLHASQQQDKAGLRTGGDFGERTVIFSTDDAFMDMTHSHTVNLASDAELFPNVSIRNRDVLLTGGEKTLMFSADDASMDLTLNTTSGSVAAGRCLDFSVERRNAAPPVPGLDREFENFLASLSKASGPSSAASAHAGSSVLHVHTPSADVDKENLVPASVSAAAERSLKTGEPSDGGALRPQADVSMNMTEALTGRILEFAEDEDPFRCLFPTQDMYARSDRTTSRPVEVMKSGEDPGYTDPTDLASMKNPPPFAPQPRHKVNFDARDKTIVFSADDEFMDMTQSHTVNIACAPSAAPPRHKVKFDARDERREKTIVFSADELMDMTQSHTVNIACAPSAAPPRHKLNFDARDKTIVFSADDELMDMTQSHTVNIACAPSAARQTSAAGPDSGFNKSLAGVSKASGSGVRVAAERAAPPAAASSKEPASSAPSHAQTPTAGVRAGGRSLNTGRSFGEPSPGDGSDVDMEMTEAQTGHITGGAASDDPFHFLFPALTRAEMTPGRRSGEAAAPSDPTGMGTSLKSSLKTRDVLDGADEHREKTVRFSAADACMDMTRSHTVDISTHLKPQPGSAPPCRDKTVRFGVDDAAMDITQCLTVNVGDRSPSDPPPVPVNRRDGEKRGPQIGDGSSAAFHSLLTRRSEPSDPGVDRVIAPDTGDPCDGGAICPDDDVSMNMTEALTGRIFGASHTEDPLQAQSGSRGPETPGPSRCKGVENPLETSLKTQMERQQARFDAEDACGEKTLRFSADDAAMDLTRCLTVNLTSSSPPDSAPPPRESDVLSTHADVDLSLTAEKRERNSAALGLDTGFENLLCVSSGPWADPVDASADRPAARRPADGVDANRRRDDVETENVAPGSGPATAEVPPNETRADSPENGVDVTEAQTGRVLGRTCTEQLPRCVSPERHPGSDRTEATSHPSCEAPGSTEPDAMEITSRPGSVEVQTGGGAEPSPPPPALSSPGDAADASRSRRSGRMSLADLQTKARRLSHMINAAPVPVAVETCVAPPPPTDVDLKTSKSLPAAEAELEAGSPDAPENAGGGDGAATPFNLKTKQLMSRLSMGGFQPKLPQRSKPGAAKKACPALNVTNQLSDLDGDVSDIYDEELDSCEDVSETLDASSPRKHAHKARLSPELADDEPSPREEELGGGGGGVHGKKRRLPEDESNVEDEKRRKACDEEAGGAADTPHSDAAAPIATPHAADCSSSSHAAGGRGDATFESTFKHSLFESQLEEHTSDAPKKLDDGSITVLEFFKLFNIDFVIHNPRQSVLPGRLLSDADRTPMDLLKDRHVSRPKQAVYEADVQNLAEKVEGLKVRMRDLDKPLKMVNQRLWEEMRNSSEKELRSFGAKLKERNNFFRKTSKAQSHEMKEELYSKLAQAVLEEQRRLRGTIEEADEMIKSLDGCIGELETELAAVEEKGCEEKPSLKSRQEELKKVSEALADDERQTSELELQTKQNSSKVARLKGETSSLQSHVAALDMVNEWTFAEKKDDCTTYAFLHDTLHLQVVYEKPQGPGAENESERKISHVGFQLRLDEEESQCHARLVHRLLSRYADSQTSWVEKYPTRRHVPELLHDVGLVVSRCRLLGEELRRLKTWGGLRLDILDVGCVDTRVHVVFSSLRTFSKFEVVFSVGLVDNLCVLKVQDVKNVIGNAALQHIEEIVDSFSPTKNLLTKIVKKIHDHLL